MIYSLKVHLEKKLAHELPGKKAHIEVAPYRRVDFTKKDIVNAKKSSVLILFYQNNNTIYVALIQRNIYDGKHSGQVAFPGGKYEETDRDIFYTALREANEEIGVTIEDVEVIGKLSDVFIPVSNFLVHPVVGFIDYHPDFTIDRSEVEEMIEIKLTDLTATKKLLTNKIRLANNTVLDVPSFVFEGRVVWGATALMLNELRYILSDWKRAS